MAGPFTCDVKVAVPVIAAAPVCDHNAVIALVPNPVSVARPDALMVATLTSLEIHFRFGELVMSCVSGVVPLNVPMAMYCEVSP